jgi:hypothetical protein
LAVTDEALLSWIDRGQLAAALLVAIGVAGEFILQFAGRPVSARIEASREMELVRLRQQTEEQRLARVKIEERLQPRSARGTPQEAIAALTKLKPFAGQMINVITYDSDRETAALADSIRGLLKDSEWIISIPPSGGAYALPPMAGVRVEVQTSNSPRDMQAAGALIGALQSLHIEVNGPRSPPMGQPTAAGSLRLNPAVKLNVVIGTKP